MADHLTQPVLAANEKILLQTRPHWMLLLRSVLRDVLLAGVILFVVTLLSTQAGLKPYAVYGLVLLVVPAASVGWDVLGWMRTQYMVTSKRTLQVSGDFRRQVLETPLEKVKSVTVAQTFWGNLFNFGEIEIQSTAEPYTNRLMRVPGPAMFQSTVLGAKKRLKTARAEQNHS